MNRGQLLSCLIGISVSLFIDGAQGRSARRLEGEGIQGGDDANEGQFPYHVTLEVRGASICGGSILSERFIITAAHCIVGDDNSLAYSRIRVVAGINDLKSKSTNRVSVRVAEAFVPQEYDDTLINTTGDIAILKLNKDIKIEANQSLAKITLPKKDEKYEGKEAIVSGFGDNKVDLVRDRKTRKFKEANHKRNGKLHFAKANVLTNQECKKLYTSLKIDKSHMCAAVIQHDKLKPEGVCAGDSGGPLVYNGVQIGVLSISPFGCDERTHPAIYTRVSDYLDFISTVVNGKTNESIRKYTLKVKTS